ncbi:amino acid ABC transporter substrate-binding protein [Mycobacterium sp. MS1601]|uniref:ABC transporter substrate-binding protein n=1 Tax=Mycobacterium sp. MS1601 TaxID=1936029 RepID=UPI00097904F3|nr:ABC transporter substrate-binding protein [Mycobacterium sp. MS1601]AQA06226.1 amino acid ABC transporter substrate-binding protein [Mycobacterium sp. MS1601]
MRKTWLPVVVTILAGCAPAEEAAAPTTSTGGDSCAKDSLQTLSAGTLTFGTDQPAYPPWFVDDDPASGKGFESAVAYAVADKLGFTPEEVTWVRVPFNAAIAPGAKTFDANLSEFSITEERKQAVDFSTPYYDVTQAVVTVASSPAAAVKDLNALKALKLGAQVGTTSYTAAEALAPAQPISVYNNNEDAKAALTSGQIDAVVLDLPTAFAVQAELDGGVIVGQLPTETDTPEQFGIVLDKGSPLTACVSSAVDELRSDGTLAELQQTWLDEAGNAPVLT